MSEDKQNRERISEILEIVEQRETQERVIEIEEKTVQLVVFLLAERYYAFYGEGITEILPVEDICFVPGMPDYIPGVIHVRGEIESVLDLRKILDLPENPITKQSRILIGEVNNIRSGILVDSVEDVLEIPEEDISEPNSVFDTERTEYITGETFYKENEMISLDLGKIFKKLVT